MIEAGKRPDLHLPDAPRRRRLGSVDSLISEVLKLRAAREQWSHAAFPSFPYSVRSSKLNKGGNSGVPGKQEDAFGLRDTATAEGLLAGVAWRRHFRPFPPEQMSRQTSYAGWEECSSWDPERSLERYSCNLRIERPNPKIERLSFRKRLRP